MTVQKIGIRYNQSARTMEFIETLKKACTEHGYLLTEQDPDLWISVGGDGAFLNTVRQTGFNRDILYTGVHTGTLGFLQEIDPNELEDFLDYLDQGDYKISHKDVLKTDIYTDEGMVTLYSLNEIVIRETVLKTLRLEIRIDEIELERFAGDGILICTSAGSSAYSMSFGGAIVDNSFATMQITPMAPLTNRAYHTLRNSFIIPQTKTIRVIPDQPDLLLTSDGANEHIHNVRQIVITTDPVPLQYLQFRETDFVSRIQEKMLK